MEVEFGQWILDIILVLHVEHLFILQTFVQCKWQIWMVPTGHLPNHHSRTSKKQQNQQQLQYLRQLDSMEEWTGNPQTWKNPLWNMLIHPVKAPTKRKWYVSFIMRTQKMFGSWMNVSWTNLWKKYVARKTFVSSSNKIWWKFSFVSVVF